MKNFKIYQNVRNADETGIRGKFIALNVYIRKKLSLKSMTSTFTLRNQKKNKVSPKEEQQKLQMS